MRDELRSWRPWTQLTTCAGTRSARSSSNTATTSARTQEWHFVRSSGSQRRTGNAVRFVFRHFPLTELHPHALAAAAAAEAAALQDQFWTMHALLFHRQNALADDYLRRYAAKLGLDVVRFDRDRTGPAVLERVRRDVRSGSATGQVTGTPTLFIDGVVHRGSYTAAALLEVLAPRLQAWPSTVAL